MGSIKVPSSEQTQQFYNNLINGSEQRGMFGKDRRFNALRVYNRPSTQKYFLDVVRSYVTKEDHVLDLGCGSGAFLCSLAGLCKDIIGVDISQKFVEEAHHNIQQLGIKNAKTAHIVPDQLPFNDNEFDVLMIFDVLHHLENIPKTLKEAFRVLKPKGKVIIFEPNKLNPLLYIMHYLDPNERGLLKLGSPKKYRAILESFMSIEQLSFNGIVIGPESSMFTLIANVLNHPVLNPLLGWLNPKMFIGGIKK